jgi:hypothetical protein
MICFIWQVRLFCICDLYQLQWKIFKKLRQQVTPGQVLKPLVRMRYIPVLRHISTEELLGLFYLPNTEPRVFVNLMLKKNWQRGDFRLMIADFRFILAKVMALGKVGLGNFEIACSRE